MIVLPLYCVSVCCLHCQGSNTISPHPACVSTFPITGIYGNAAPPWYPYKYKHMVQAITPLCRPLWYPLLFLQPNKPQSTANYTANGSLLHPFPKAHKMTMCYYRKYLFLRAGGSPHKQKPLDNFLLLFLPNIITSALQLETLRDPLLLPHYISGRSLTVLGSHFTCSFFWQRKESFCWESA